jgi:hypothetical protein
MKPLYKGLIIALVHLCIVSSLGAKLLYDRTVRPRVWVLAAPYDPDMPIRGRYVSLQLVVEPRDIKEVVATGRGWVPPQLAVLRIENNRLVAEGDTSKAGFYPEGIHVRFVQRQERKLAVIEQPVAFFIPEHVPDPSRRQPGEELWVEVTIPRKGPPRPIQLGIKKGEGPIVPLAFN